MTKSRYEARIEDYVEAVREVAAFKQANVDEGETVGRASALKLAIYRVKLCEAGLRGQDLGEARRRLRPSSPAV